MDNFFDYINLQYVIALILVSYGIFSLFDGSIFEIDYRFVFLMKYKAFITLFIGMILLFAFYYFEYETNFMKLICSFGFATSFYQLFIKVIIKRLDK